MESNFTLHLRRQLNPFYGDASDQRLMGMFLFTDGRLVQSVKMILGKSFGNMRHRYKTNMDVYSLIIAWGLDLGELTRIVREVMEMMVHRYFLEGLESILEWVVPGEYFDYREGFENVELKGAEGCTPFVHCLEDQIKN